MRKRAIRLPYRRRNNQYNRCCGWCVFHQAPGHSPAALFHCAGDVLPEISSVLTRAHSGLSMIRFLRNLFSRRRRPDPSAVVEEVWVPRFKSQKSSRFLPEHTRTVESTIGDGKLSFILKKKKPLWVGGKPYVSVQRLYPRSYDSA